MEAFEKTYQGPRGDDLPKVAPFSQFQTESTIFRLPIELRLRIYAHATRQTLEETCRSDTLPPSTSLQFLLTCRRIYHEAQAEAFRNTTFCIPSSCTPNFCTHSREDEVLCYFCIRLREGSIPFKHRLRNLSVQSLSNLRSLVLHIPTTAGDEYLRSLFGRSEVEVAALAGLRLKTIDFFIEPRHLTPILLSTPAMFFTFAMILGTFETLEKTTFVQEQNYKTTDFQVDRFLELFDSMLPINIDEVNYRFLHRVWQGQQRYAKCFAKPAIDRQTLTWDMEVRGLWVSHLADPDCFKDPEPWFEPARKVKVQILLQGYGSG